MDRDLMVKGVSIKLTSYDETVPRLLKLIKFDNVLREHERIVLKPNLVDSGVEGTPVEFVEAVLKFCMENKNPGTELFIADGCDGFDTMDIFEEQGYKQLAEKYGVGLIDLNRTETEEVQDGEFMHFGEIVYPSILLNSFVVSLPAIRDSQYMRFVGSLSNMLGAYPSKEYKGFFSKRKNKLDSVPMKYRIHDILKCKMPEFTVADAGEMGYILAGQPIEIDKQGAKMYGIDWKEVDYLRIAEESFYRSPE